MPLVIKQRVGLEAQNVRLTGDRCGSVFLNQSLL